MVRDPNFIPTEQQLAEEIDDLAARISKIEAILEDRKRQSDNLSKKIDVVTQNTAADLDKIESVLARAVLASNGGPPLSDADRKKLNDWSGNPVTK